MTSCSSELQSDHRWCEKLNECIENFYIPIPKILLKDGAEINLQFNVRSRNITSETDTTKYSNSTHELHKVYFDENNDFNLQLSFTSPSFLIIFIHNQPNIYINIIAINTIYNNTFNFNISRINGVVSCYNNSGMFSDLLNASDIYYLIVPYNKILVTTNPSDYLISLGDPRKNTSYANLLNTANIHSSLYKNITLELISCGISILTQLGSISNQLIFQNNVFVPSQTATTTYTVDMTICYLYDRIHVREEFFILK